MNCELVRNILIKREALFEVPPGVYRAGNNRKEVIISRVYPYVHDMSVIGKEIAEMAINLEGFALDGVISPSLILAHWVARHLMLVTGSEILALSTIGKDEEINLFPTNSSELVWGKKFLLINANQEHSSRFLARRVLELGGLVTVVGSICNPCGLDAVELGVPKLFSLFEAEEIASVAP